MAFFFIIPGYGRMSFESAASWLDQATAQEASSVQATNLPVASALPNALSPEAYSYLDRAWGQSLLATELSSLQTLLPQLDIDDFMSELTNAGVDTPFGSVL